MGYPTLSCKIGFGSNPFDSSQIDLYAIFQPPTGPSVQVTSSCTA